MNRAQHHLEKREKIRTRVKTYNYTEEQLKQSTRSGAQKEIAKIKQDSREYGSVRLEESK